MDLKIHYGDRLDLVALIFTLVALLYLIMQLIWRGPESDSIKEVISAIGIFEAALAMLCFCRAHTLSWCVRLRNDNVIIYKPSWQYAIWCSAIFGSQLSVLYLTVTNNEVISIKVCISIVGLFLILLAYSVWCLLHSTKKQFAQLLTTVSMTIQHARARIIVRVHSQRHGTFLLGGVCSFPKQKKRMLAALKTHYPGIEVAEIDDCDLVQSAPYPSMIFIPIPK